MPGVVKSGLADVVAVCDLDARRRAEGAVVVAQLGAGTGAPVAKVDQYGDYRELLARRTSTRS